MNPTKYNIKDLLQACNAVFHTLIAESWYIYGIAICILSTCLYFLVKNYRRDKEIQQFREELRRSSERQIQRRRPGAVHREHEIFRNILINIRQLQPADPKSKCVYVLRRTPSGQIRGTLA